MDRCPHAVGDLSSRYLKAQKIERLLGLPLQWRPIRLLDIGTGSGGIAHYFATKARGEYEVTAVDVVDVRVVRDGYSFHRIPDTNLPFPEDRFDVVLSNHVIEHVGKIDEQVNHLREILRVLAADGVAYLAAPNRWMLVEPHYRLPFLSWLPRSMRDGYVRATKRGNWYDCEPLSLQCLEKLLSQVGFHYENLCVGALREMLRLERKTDPLVRVLRFTPNSVLNRLSFFMPTLVYRLRIAGK